VQLLLDESDRLAVAGQSEKAVEAAEQAGTLAQTEKDLPGKACAFR